MSATKSVFETLSNVDVSDHIDDKGGLSYVSWAWAWAYVKNVYPKAKFIKHNFTDNTNNVLPFMRDTKGFTYVQVTVEIEDESQTEILPVMNNKNQGVSHPTSTEVNKALQRCLVKAIAFHGLGLSVYAGEDLPVMGSDHQEKIDALEAGFIESPNTETLDNLWRQNAPFINSLSVKEKGGLTKVFTNAKQKISKEAA